MGFIYGKQNNNFQGNQPKTDFLTSWLSDQSGNWISEPGKSRFPRKSAENRFPYILA